MNSVSAKKKNASCDSTSSSIYIMCITIMSLGCPKVTLPKASATLRVAWLSLVLIN